MTSARKRIRNWMACYGAALTIMFEQLSAIPRSSVTVTPTPLVRVRQRFESESEWHLDELFTEPSGRQRVLVWEPSMNSSTLSPARILQN